MLHYLNENLTLDECREIDRQKLTNFKEVCETMRKGAEELPPEQRAEYIGICLPLAISLWL